MKNPAMRWKTITRWILLSLSGLLLVIFLIIAIGGDRTYLGRLVLWNVSDIYDHERFPYRIVPASANPVSLKAAPDSVGDILRDIVVHYNFRGDAMETPLQELLVESNTTSFLVLQGDKILYESYFKGTTRETLNRSFSVAKSLTATLVGIALDRGLIQSVNDPVLDYLPDLTGSNIAAVTIRNLLMMNPGWRFSDGPFPWTDDTILYYTPSVRNRLQNVLWGRFAPGEKFIYNNHSTYLLAMVLEQASGMTLSDFTGRYLWEPLGAEYDATFSMNSQADGLEQAPSGFNAAGVDFAKLGLLYLYAGQWNGKRILSGDFIQEATTPAVVPEDYYTDWEIDQDVFYKYQWWGHELPDGKVNFFASGAYGQVIYVCPAQEIVILRFGEERGRIDFGWHVIARDICAQFGAR